MILSDRDPTIPKTTFSIESEIQVKVEESLLMPAVFHTVASRTQLALVSRHVLPALHLPPPPSLTRCDFRLPGNV